MHIYVCTLSDEHIDAPFLSRTARSLDRTDNHENNSLVLSPCVILADLCHILPQIHAEGKPNCGGLFIEHSGEARVSRRLGEVEDPA